MQKLISQTDNYTFSDYFKLNNEPDEIIKEFNYQFERKRCQLPKATITLNRLEDVLLRWNEGLAYIGLNSEMAKREFLIAPIILETVRYTQAKVRVEYPLNVNPQLKGTLDYLLQAQRNFLIVEAKQGDLEHGFLQLAIELIALDKWLDSDTEIIYGAVSTGQIWRFGVLQRKSQLIIQDLNLFRIPEDVEDLLKIMIGILTNELF
jgi:hypothetical protein